MRKQVGKKEYHQYQKLREIVIRAPDLESGDYGKKERSDRAEQYEMLRYRQFRPANELRHSYEAKEIPGNQIEEELTGEDGNWK